MSLTRALTGLLALSLPAFALGSVSKDLPLPTGTPTADEIAAQVYFVNHFYAMRNYAIKDSRDAITVLILRTGSGSVTTNTLSRYLNNDYPANSDIKAKDLAIFHSGKLRGTGMLIVDYSDDARSQSYSIWLPAIRKIRRFAQPAHDDAWGGSDFTFGDVTLRKPFHEDHELLGTETFSECLNAMQDIEVRHLSSAPEPACDHRGKAVYKLKSATKFPNWWYDYRVSYVDTGSFADYRTEYFKDGEMIKIIDRHWVSMGLPDPRAQSWGYWYGKTLRTGHETWAVIPQEVVEINADIPERFWSESTLEAIRR
jgi:hypothetical protein